MGGSSASIVSTVFTAAAIAAAIFIPGSSFLLAAGWEYTALGGLYWSAGLMAAGQIISGSMGGNSKKSAKSYSFSSSVSGRSLQIKQSNAPARYIYGQCLVSGVLTWVCSNGTSNKNLYTLWTLSWRPLGSVLKYYLYDEEVTLDEDGWVTTGDYANLVRFTYGNGTVSGDATIQAALEAVEGGGWTTLHRQYDCAKLLMQCTHDDVFTGIPEFYVLVEGHAVYDPRDDSTAVSSNAGLCIRDFLSDEHVGIKATDDELPDAVYTAAANICAESVALLSGGSEPRYTCRGSFTLDSTPQSVLESLLTSCCGDATYSGGEFLLFPGAWREPVIDFTEDDLDGVISDLQTRTTRSELCNGVKGQYSDPDTWEATNYPSVASDTFKTEDGGDRLWKEFDQAWTNSASQAQRVARVQLFENRQQIVMTLPLKLTGLRARPGKNITYTSEKLGWDQKAFKVINMTIAVRGEEGSPRLGVDLKVKETAEASFTWSSSYEQTVDPAPDTTLLSPFDVAAPTGLALESGTAALYMKSDGTVVSRIHATWTAPEDEFVTKSGKIEIQYKPSSESDWVDASSTQGSLEESYIYDVEDGLSYDVRIRSRNHVGFYSEWTTPVTETVVGKTENPSDVTGFSIAARGSDCLAAWTKISDADIDFYEIRDTDIVWGDDDAITTSKGSSTPLPAQSSGSHTFYIKARDTSGNYSSNAASAVVNITAPTVSSLAASYLTASVKQGSVINLSWTGVAGSHDIARYWIKRGTAWASATDKGYVDATSASFSVDWAGTVTWWVAAIDIAGNVGTPVSIDATVVLPVNSALTLQVIDNSVLLRWTATEGSLPIATHNVYRDAVDPDHLVGTSNTTFDVIDEVASGTYQYFVEPVDSAGNEGTYSSATATVDEPPDFVLHASFTADFTTAILSNAALLSDGSILVPVNTTETWGEHFTASGMTSMQDFITAGYTYYPEPNPTTATYQEDFDAGAVISGCRIIADIDYATVDESVTATPRIYTRETESDPWTAQAAGQWQVYANNFRYVRMEVTFTAADDTSLLTVAGMSLALRVKQTTDSGTVSVATQGQTVSFNKTFIDCDSPVVTPQGTSAVIAVVDFLDAPNPTGFDVYLFDTAGSAATLPITIGWTVRGTLQGG